MKKCIYILLFLIAQSYVAMAQPANDPCSGAYNITCGQIRIGNTTTATIDTVPYCSPDFPDIQLGIWYKFTGTGDYITATTCLAATNFDTKLIIYSGTCGNLTCLTGSDDAGGTCGGKSTAYFSSVLGTDYYILVASKYTLGAFTLRVSCAPACTSPINDDCATAINLPIAPDTSSFVPVLGTNSCANLNLYTASCVWWESGVNTQDVWYQFNSGANAQIVLDFNPLTVSYLNCALYTSCGSTIVSCYTLTAGQNIIPLNPNTNYFIQLYNTGGVDAGTFEIALAAPPPPPANDSCINAILVTCGTSQTGSTNFATLDTLSPSCSSLITPSANGVWYQFVGTGDAITLSTCNAVTNYDTKIIVYSGSCTGLVCEAGNEDAGSGPCGFTGKSIAYFNSVLGTTYYILVTGWELHKGNFQMDISCDPPCASPPANDDCATATVLTMAVDTFSFVPTIGTNSCANITLDNPWCNIAYDTKDVWYKFNTGTSVSAILKFETITGVNFNYAFYNSCGGTANMLDCEVLVSGRVVYFTGLSTNTDYWIQIYNYGGVDTGSFSIAVCDGPPPPPHDNCTNVAPITITNGNPPVPMPGTTLGGSINAANEWTPTVWEAFTLTGACNDVTLDFCGSPTTYLQQSSFGFTLDIDCLNTPAIWYGSSTWGGVNCFDNSTFIFRSIPAGTYYFPIRVLSTSDPNNGNNLGPYTLLVSSEDATGCLVTGIEEEKAIAKKSFVLFPNPASDILNFTSDFTSSDMIIIYNELGQVVLNESYNASIDISKLDNGIYFVQIQSEGVIATEKFIKM